MNYWMDILCMGETAEKQELFIKNRSFLYNSNIGNSKKGG
jgi:hypothetical protein